MNQRELKIIIRADGSLAVEQLGKVAQEVDKTGEATKKASKEVKGYKTQWHELATGINQAIGVLGKMGQTIGAGWNLAKAAAEAGKAKDNLLSLSRAVGISYDELMAKSAKATGELVSDISLVRNNHAALRLGISEDVEEISRLWQVAGAVGDDFGQSIEDTFKQITTAISEGNSRSLISLGLLPDSFTRASDTASLLERRTVLLSEVLRQFGPRADAAAAGGDKAADKFTRFETAVENLRIGLGDAMVDVFLPTTEWMVTDLIPLLKTSIDYWREWFGFVNHAETTYRRHGAAGKLAALDDRRRELLALRDRLEKHEGYNIRRETLEAAGVKVDGWFPDLHELTKEAKQRIELELKGNEVAAERIKIAGIQAAAEERRAEAAKKEEQERSKQAAAEQARAEESLKKLQEAAVVRDLTRQFVKGLGVEAVDSIDKARITLEMASAAAGGFAVSLDIREEIRGLQELDREFDRLIPKISKAFAGDFAGTIHGELQKITLANLSPETAIEGFWATSLGLTGAPGLADAFKKVLDGDNFKATASRSIEDNIGQPLMRTVAVAISDGFARADFSGFLRSLGGGVSSVVGGVVADTIQSAIMQRNTGSLAGGNSILGGLFKPVVNKSGSLNWSNLGQNLAVGGALSFLTSPGRLFGGRVVKGQENFDTSASLNDQVNQAKELRDQLFLQVGISEVTRQLLDEAEFYYTWVRKTKSGNGITSKKTTTYLLEGSGMAQASIDNIKQLQETVLGEQTQRDLRMFQVGRADSVRALEMMVSDARSAYNASFATVMSSSELGALDAQMSELNRRKSAIMQQQQQQMAAWGGGYRGGYYPYNNHWQINAIEQQIATLAQQKREGQDYKYSLAERTAMQQQYEQAQIDLTTAREAGRTNLTQTFLGSSTLASFASPNMLKKLLGDKAIGSDATMIREMLPLLKQSGLADFDLAKMYLEAGADPEKQYDVLAKQGEHLRDAASVYEQIWKDAEAEALNARLSIEQQRAAFERFQMAQAAFLEVKEQLLQQEQQLAAMEKQKLDSRRIAQMESALSLVGEISQRDGKTVTIIQAGDSAEAIRLMMQEFTDNPEVTAVLKKTLEKAEALPRWG